MLRLTPQTTAGSIALQNLAAQIAGRERLAGWVGVASAQPGELIDLLTLRGHVLGQISDYERASALAEEVVQASPNEGMAYVSRARTRATFHRFRESLADLDRAEALGVAPALLLPDRAAALAGTGRPEPALALLLAAAKRRPDISTLGALALLFAELGDLARADATFRPAIAQYRGTSPFPVAALEFERGRMWLERNRPTEARIWLAAAVERLPAYAPAQGHLAQVEATLREYEPARIRLYRLATSSDDPEYAGELARVLEATGETAEAERWRQVAARRYAALVERYPAAFADHAAEFWLGAGHDPFRAVALAAQNLHHRPTRRARRLLHRALRAARG